MPLSRKFEKVVTLKGRKFKLSAQGQDLALFVGNGTKIKILAEIKLPLAKSERQKYTNNSLRITLIN